jgi:hypothetical protein
MKFTVTTLVCLAAFALPQSARAQEPPPPSALAQPLQLKIAAAMWTAAVASDHVTTYQFRTDYPDLLHEQNPLVRGLEDHPAWLVGANAAIDAATGWVTYRWLGSRHPRLAMVAFYAAAAYRASLSIHNVRMMNRAGAVETRVR